MPLASLFALHFYGPCAAAAVGEVLPTADATLHYESRLGAVSTASAFSPFAKLTRGHQMAGFNTASASSPFAQLRQRYTIGAVGKVNELSQDDVTGAVLNAKIEGDYTLRDVMRIMASAMAAKVSGAETATVRFRDLADTKDRIVSVTDVDGNRTSVTLDPS